MEFFETFYRKLMNVHNVPGSLFVGTFDSEHHWRRGKLFQSSKSEVGHCCNINYLEHESFFLINADLQIAFKDEFSSSRWVWRVFGWMAG